LCETEVKLGSVALKHSSKEISGDSLAMTLLANVTWVWTLEDVDWGAAAVASVAEGDMLNNSYSDVYINIKKS
jgi:hypothetical protein